MMIDQVLEYLQRDHRLLEPDYDPAEDVTPELAELYENAANEMTQLIRDIQNVRELELIAPIAARMKWDLEAFFDNLGMPPLLQAEFCVTDQQYVETNLSDLRTRFGENTVDWSKFRRCQPPLFDQ
jgi:hypothetical protein